ncbi:DUF1488 domain-containing protein [Pseudoalteromonas sp. SSDWG2]|uniref:DUF1488 domain-containing protein n=1 Tax=Pseudoalteromonas sp. SSDWG2 TaxID=3139391 RepID=UPI003BA91672
MNQAIQFVDRVEYDNGVMTFYAMVSGLLLPCVIELGINERSDALAHFAQHRFDYEEIAESLIEDEEYGEDGIVKVKSLA